MTECTWKDCTAEAKHNKIDQSEKIWSKLCDDHEKEFSKIVSKQDYKAILKMWVLAQGGSKKAIRRL